MKLLHFVWLIQEYFFAVIHDILLYYSLLLQYMLDLEAFFAV